MKLAVPKERLSDESRVAVSPETVKKLISLGFEVVIEGGAGDAASFSDKMYENSGASISSEINSKIAEANLVLKVRGPAEDAGDDLSQYSSANILVASFSALSNIKSMEKLAATGVTAFAMELMPRITRAQSMDILSSQSNLAGYKAVIDAAGLLGRAYPMMMTAAGTIPPAKVFIMGVGVAGLQAIATAKRLGAVVTATDVRPSTKEQVESLGGKFLEVDVEMERDSQSESGYAKEMSPEYLDKQKEVVAEHIKKQDVVITTALIPGRSAPVLVTPEMVATMPDGAVLVDLAAEFGGNCPLSELGKTIKSGGVSIVGPVNLPSQIAEDASKLFAKNLLNFVTLIVESESKSLKVDWGDEIVQGTLVCRGGKVVHPGLNIKGS